MESRLGNRRVSRIGRCGAALMTFTLWVLAGCEATPSPSATARPVAPSVTDVAPSVSPTPAPVTGRIAYVHNAGEPGDVPATDIWVIDAQGGQPTALTSDPENEFSPFWLLDGSRLVFAVFDFRTEIGPYQGTLISVLPDGSDRKDLAPVADWSDAVLSPDGRYVAWGGGGTNGITLLDRSSGDANVLTTDGATVPIWSPDGTALLVREPVLGSVAVIDVPSGHVTRFRKPEIREVLGWTADGQAIVFISAESPSTPAWMALATGGPVVPLPPNAELAPRAWSSPDGLWIVGRRLEIQEPTGGEAVTVAPGLRMLTGAPSWSPDASALAFAGSTIEELGDRTSAIYVVSIDGKTPTRITTGPLDTWPAWEPAS